MAARVGEETSVKVWVGTAATGVMSFTKSTMARPAMPTKTGAPSRKARPTAVPKVQTSAPGVASGPSSLPKPAASAANPRPGAPSASSGQEPGSGSEASLQRKVRKTTERPASRRSQRRRDRGRPPGEDHRHAGQRDRHHRHAPPEGDAPHHHPRLGLDVDEPRRGVGQHRGHRRRHPAGEDLHGLPGRAVREEVEGGEVEVLAGPGGEQRSQEADPEGEVLDQHGGAGDRLAGEAPPHGRHHRQRDHGEQHHHHEEVADPRRTTLHEPAGAPQGSGRPGRAGLHAPRRGRGVGWNGWSAHELRHSCVTGRERR